MGNSVASRASFKEDVDEYMIRRKSSSSKRMYERKEFERKEESETFAVVPNITEIRGFVIWIFTIISYFVFILWTLLPRESLIYMGVSYYPSKYVHLFLLFTSQHQNVTRIIPDTGHSHYLHTLSSPDFLSSLHMPVQI